MERFTDSQTWHVVFSGSTVRRWWNLFLHPCWRHVMLVQETTDGCLCVNPLAHAMALKFYPNTLEEILPPNVSAVLTRTVHYSMVYQNQLPDLLTCVSIAKRILCIRAWVITPRGLYRELIKSGAIISVPFIEQGFSANMV